MKVLNTVYILIVIFISLSIVSCDSGDSKSDIEFDIIRYERMVFGIDINNVKEEFETLKYKYPQITNIYFKNVLDIPGYQTDDSIFFQELKTFVSDSSMRELYKLSEEEFGEMDNLKKQFKSVFENAKSISKNIEIPKIYSFISGFVMQRFVFEDKDGMAIAFGTDMFLGDKFDYERLERGQGTFSNYFVRTYNKDHLVKKVLGLWLDDILGEPSGGRAIDKMIKNGKKLYIIKQLMPDIQDSILLDYSKEQMEWLNNNEQEMWSFFIKNELFYTTDQYKIKRLISPAPNSQALGMPGKSPGRTGNYIGYRVVDAYMKRNNETTLDVLIGDNNAQKILTRSKFKPQRRNN